MKPAFDLLQIDERSVQLMRDSFEKIDILQYGSFAIRELESLLTIEAIPFNNRVFSMFDDFESGDLNFLEYILMLWNYCTLDESSLGKSIATIFETA
jgi:Ca2+-binding EF-hand superfamily protein